MVKSGDDHSEGILSPNRGPKVPVNFPENSLKVTVQDC